MVGASEVRSALEAEEGAEAMNIYARIATLAGELACAGYLYLQFGWKAFAVACTLGALGEYGRGP